MHNHYKHTLHFTYDLIHMKFQKIESNMSCTDIVQCVFNFNKMDIEVYKKLQKLGETRANILSKHINRERSTVYRSLQKLTNCGLCDKKTKTIVSGGYYHIYSCKDAKTIKIQLENCIDEWYRSMKKIISNFEMEIN